MKKLFLLSAATLMFSASVSFAATPNTNMWYCTTNASSAPSGSAGDAADKNMAKTAKSGAEAFNYAMQNCRDCTKITCTQQS